MDASAPLLKEFSRQDGPLFAAGVSRQHENPGKKPDLSKEDVQSDPSKVLDLENVTLVFECEEQGAVFSDEFADAEPFERGQFYGEGSQYQSLELAENICTVSWETDGDGGGYSAQAKDEKILVFGLDGRSPERRWGILALIVPSDSEPKAGADLVRFNVAFF
ncbi:hypothetical protein AK812_SmicGene14289 [Symbiodinium microadriaticum]|uniref:Uncharacterized protein n=1 Tax=Symbiodinium microadriaticum TaxID=2951 RepID=A0A1Q9E5X1_SYMMI|nr:hypothetical protein AK812_SmicGene14289 [Symbiodinium microadriaticum]